MQIVKRGLKKNTKGSQQAKKESSGTLQINISIKCTVIHFKGRGDVVSYNVCMWVYLVLIGFVITDSHFML